MFHETDPVNGDWYEAASRHKQIINERSKSNENIGPMLNKTRALLEQFYLPHKIQLAKLLDDDIFLWQ